MRDSSDAVRLKKKTTPRCMPTSARRRSQPLLVPEVASRLEMEMAASFRWRSLAFRGIFWVDEGKRRTDPARARARLGSQRAFSDVICRGAM